MGIMQATLGALAAGLGVIATIVRWRLYSSSLGGSSTCSLTIGADGSISVVSDVVLNAGGTLWYNPITPAVGNSYWVRATVTSGALTSGTTGSWLALTSARTWSVVADSGNILAQATFTIQIASDAAGTTIVGTMTGNFMQANYNEPNPGGI